MVMTAAAAAEPRRRDAEAELNLPPGFRFHPTDEELVAHYLCARAAGRAAPVPIIAELDLYRFNPWELPDRALFGAREWYFFTPRDRKYPNGSRPNRAAGDGYWKATGADRPVAHAGRTAGIKKALVFYHGKPPRGVKTEWIMHEYRLASSDTKKKKNKDGTATLRLDDWVLCRLYNKKNEWEKRMMLQQTHTKVEQQSPVSWGDTRTPESEIDNNDSFPPELLLLEEPLPAVVLPPKEEVKQELEDNDDWLMGINLDDLQLPWDDSYASSFLSPVAAMKMERDLSPFF